jgi:hypothetical protein
LMTDVFLPVLPCRALVLDSLDAARSGDASPGSGPRSPSLGGRVTLGGPIAVPLRALDVADDPDLRAFVEQEAAHSEYHLIHLSLGFEPTPVTPRLRSAGVALAMSSPTTAQQPIAWSMAPRIVDDTAEVSTSVQFAPQLKLSMLGEVSVGQAQRGTTRRQGRVFLEALREMQSDPAWHLYRTPSMSLRGVHRLVLVVRAAVGATTEISVTVEAKTQGRFLRRFGHTLPDPLRITERL